MLSSGKTVRQVSNHFGVSSQTIYSYFKGEPGLFELRAPRGSQRKSARKNPKGVRGRPPSITAEQIAELTSQRKAGKSVKHIAAKLGISENLVYRYLQKRKTGKGK